LTDYTLWGPNPARFHLTGILIHLCTGMVVAYLCRLLGAPHYVAALGSLLFLVHPVAAKPVGLVSLRADLWCSLFSLLSIVSLVHWERQGARANRWFLWFSYLASFLALLSKEAGLFLPLFFAGYHLARHRNRPHGIWMTIRAAWPYLAVVAAYVVIRFGILQVAMGKQNEFPPMGPWSLLISLSRLAFSYLTEPLAPTLVDRLWLPRILSGFPDVTVLASWLGLSAFGAVVWYAWRRDRTDLLLGLLLLSLPVLPLLKIGAISGEDVGLLLPFEAHRMYIPTAGLAVLWCLAVTFISTRARSWRSDMLRAGLLVPIAALAALFPSELGAYRNADAMFEQKVARISGFTFDELPPSLQALRITHEAAELKHQGRYREAEAQYQRILKIIPYDASALKSLAVLAVILGEPDQAITYLRTVLNPVPHRSPDGSVKLMISDEQLRDTGKVQMILARAYQMKGQHEEARSHLLLAHKIDPSNTEILLLLAWNATLLGNARGAREYLSDFLAVTPPTDPRYAFAATKMRQLDSPGSGGTGRPSDLGDTLNMP
jgi:tetratricopeptide (TPR) repeat protein